jgi:hypothetical protein
MSVTNRLGGLANRRLSSVIVRDFCPDCFHDAAL